MKTTDLEGPALEYWFARATGEGIDLSTISCAEYVEYGGMPGMFGWAEVGPVIERERIALIPLPRDPNMWGAKKNVFSDEFDTIGATPLIAAMRCVVMAKFGTEVGA